MKIELLRADQTVAAIVDTGDPGGELAFYGPQLGAVAWREWQDPGPTAEEIRAARLAAIDVQTAAAITGGFVSTASGAPYTYDSSENDQKNISLMQTVAHSPRFESHPIYQGRIPIRAIPQGGTQKEVLYLTAGQMDLLIEDMALHIGACKMAGWAAQAEV